MLEVVIILAIVDVSLSLLLAIKAKEKEIGFERTLNLSIILSPIVGMFFVMMSKRKNHKRVRNKTRCLINLNINNDF